MATNSQGEMAKGKSSLLTKFPQKWMVGRWWNFLLELPPFFRCEPSEPLVSGRVPPVVENWSYKDSMPKFPQSPRVGRPRARAVLHLGPGGQRYPRLSSMAPSGWKLGGRIVPRELGGKLPRVPWFEWTEFQKKKWDMKLNTLRFFFCFSLHVQMCFGKLKQKLLANKFGGTFTQIVCFGSKIIPQLSKKVNHKK